MRAVGGEEGRLGESKVERRSSKDTMPGRSSYSHFVCCYTWCDPHASKRHSSSSFWAVLGGQSGQGANCGWEGAPPGHAGKVDRYLGSPTKFSTHFTPATLRNEPSAGQVRKCYGPCQSKGFSPEQKCRSVRVPKHSPSTQPRYQPSILGVLKSTMG